MKLRRKKRRKERRLEDEKGRDDEESKKIRYFIMSDSKREVARVPAERTMGKRAYFYELVRVWGHF